MRKIFISLFMLLSCTLMAQVTLQHTFVGNDHSFVTYDYTTPTSLIYQDNTTELYGGAYYQTSFDTTTYTIKQYDTDYNLRSTRTFNIPVISGYYASSCSVSKTLFDDDANSYELVVNYRLVSTSGDYNRNNLIKIVAYKENGTVIADFGTGEYMYFYPYLHVYDREYRAWVSRREYVNPTYISGADNNYDCNYYYDVYKVNKRNASGLQQVPAHDMPRKVMYDGKVFIIAGDRVIDVLGRDVR